MVVVAVLVTVVAAPHSAVPFVASARGVQWFQQVYWTIPWWHQLHVSHG